MTEQPYIVFDTNAIMDMAKTLGNHNMTALRIFGYKAGPQAVLTESVGKEVFGGKSFSLSGGPDSIVQSMDAEGRLTLKPWEEAEQILIKNGAPAEKSTQSFFLQKYEQYAMLNRLAEQGRLTGMSTGQFGTKEAPHRFSGLVKDEGERAVAAAEAELSANGKTVFIVSADEKAAKTIMGHPGNADRTPRIVSTKNYFHSLTDAGVITPEQEATLIPGMRDSNKINQDVNVIKKGLALSNDPAALQAAYDSAPGELAKAIKDYADSRAATLAAAAEAAEEKITAGKLLKEAGPAVVLAAGPVVEGGMDGYQSYKAGDSPGTVAMKTLAGADNGMVDAVIPGARNGFDNIIGKKDLTTFDRILNTADAATTSATTVSAGATVAGVETGPFDIVPATATGISALGNVAVNLTKAGVKFTGFAGKDQDGGYIYDGAAYAGNAVARVLGVSGDTPDLPPAPALKPPEEIMKEKRSDATPQAQTVLASAKQATANVQLLAGESSTYASPAQKKDSGLSVA